MFKKTGTAAIVADDHELFRAGLAEILRRDLHFERVVECSSIEEIVTVLEEISGVTFMTLDLAMPGMLGASTVHELRCAYPSIQICVITASDKRDDILHLLQAGVHGFIPKALGILEIKTALRRVMGGQIYVPPVLSMPIAEEPIAMRGGFEPGAATGAKDAKLSPRQKEVLSLMAKGCSNKEIARKLGLAEGTIKVHVNALFRSLGAHNRVTAVASLAHAIELPALS
ncbi:response regulator [Methylobacterium marchantiae]